MGRIKERTKMEQSLRQQKMGIDAALKLLKIVVIRETRNWKGVPQVSSLRKETVRIEVVVASG